MRFLSKTLSVILSCAVLISSSASLVFSSENKDYAISAFAAEVIGESTIVTDTEKSISTYTADHTEDAEQPFDIFEIYDAYKNFLSGNPSDMPLNGIDVSEHQANVDWTKVKSSGIDFAIIRAGYGKEYDQEDKYFDQNMINAQKNGINCGVYWYSYAESVEEAYQEAEVCYSIIKEYNYQYPVYFDIEERKHERMTTAEVSAIIEAFCSTLKSKGYRVGIYSYANFLSTKIYTSVIQKYDVWVANFDVDTPAYTGEYGIWQYSCTGSVNGIYGDVDLNYGYVDYSKLTGSDIVTTTTTVSTSGTVTTTTTTTTGDSSTTTKPEVKNGINVSVWQGKIDWKLVKENGTEFAIIRAGYGNLASQEDPYFDTNMINAQAAGIDCGAYWYSYAQSPEEAVVEAEVCYSIIKDYTYEYPIIFAIEDPSQASLSAEKISAIIDAFCSTLEEKGYYVAVQTNVNFLMNKIDESIIDKYDVCVEHFNVSEPVYDGSYTIWHYSCTGQVQGIYGDVNLLYSYYDYPNIISKKNANY